MKKIDHGQLFMRPTEGFLPYFCVAVCKCNKSTLLSMSDQKSTQEDQISLSSMKMFTLQVAEVLFTLFDFLAAILRRKIWIIVLITAIGALAGYITYNLKPRFFFTEMTVQNSNLSRNTYAEIVKKLNNQLIAQSYDELSTELKLPVDQIRSLHSLEVTGMDNGIIKGDTSTRLHLTFKIAARLGDNLVVRPLQKALLEYLNTNPYNLRTKLEEHRLYTERLARIDAELKRMDTLKINYNRSLLGPRLAATIYNDAFNPAELYEVSLKFMQEREAIERWLRFEQDAIVLIDGFKTPTKTQSATLQSCVLIGMLLGFALGFLLSLVSLSRSYLLTHRTS